MPTYPITIPPAYQGWAIGSSPFGQFGFEYNGFQYLFLLQAGAGPLGVGDNKLHTLRSADAGATWTELDAANAPLIPSTNGGDYTLAKDGTTVIVLWVRHTTGPVMGGLTGGTFNLATGLWGTPTDYAAPVLDFLTSAQVFVQLVVRGASDYILYYSGPRETVSSLRRSRLYYATFNGATFGTGTELPAQTGLAFSCLPLSACVDSAGITHFLYQNGAAGFGVSDTHVGLDASNVFGTVGLITGDDVAAATYTGSQLILIPGSPEILAFVTNVYDAGFLVYLKMFYAPAELNPTWAASQISDNQSLQIYPDQTNLVPLSVALGYANGTLVCLWAVSSDSSDSGTFDWYWTKAVISSAPASAPHISSVTAP